MSQTISERLEYLRKANSNQQWKNHDLYRLMYKRDLYVLAYERIKSKPGNMTPGTDGATLDGFSLDRIDALIQELRTEQFSFQPVRTTFIPKPNGQLRKLGIPICDFKRMSHRTWTYFESHLCYTMALFNLLIEMRADQPDDSGFLPLSIVDFDIL